MTKIIKAELEHLFWIRMLWEMLAKEKPMVHPLMGEDTADEFTTVVAKAMQDPNIPFAVFLAFKGRRAVGFVCMEIRYRPVGTPHYYAFGHWLYVRPEHRGKGVAKDLIATAINWIRGYNVDTVELMTAYGDTLWKSKGFTPFSTYYFHTVDAIESEWELASAKGRKSHGR